MSIAWSVIAVAAWSASPEAAQRSDESLFALGVVEVVGVAEDARNPARPETVDAEALRRSARRNVAEAVERLPGVTVQNSGQRSEKLVYVRGFNSRQVPVFIDGVPVYVPYDGNVDLGRLGVDDLSAVVVTKGLTSVLYGPNALGGSINLVSRRPVAPLEAGGAATLAWDSDGDLPARRANARIATRQQGWYAQAHASWQDTTWFRLSDDAVPGPAEDGGRRDNSGSHDASFSAKLGLLPNDSDEYVLSYYRLDGQKDTPPYAGRAAGVSPRYWRWPEWDKESLYFIGRHALGDATTLRMRAYYDAFKNTLASYDDARYRTQLRNYAFTSRYDDDTVGASLELEQRWSATQTTRFSLQARQDTHRETDTATSPWERFEDRYYSLAAEHEARSGAWRFTPGIAWHAQRPQRADNLLANGSIAPFAVDEDSALNASLAAGYALAEETEVFAGLSRKTRFPTLKDRYSYRLGSALPNPALQAERADTLELGITARHGNLSYRAALFRSDLDDAIENVTLPTTACTRPPCFQQQNIGAARHEGVELSASVEFSDATRLNGHYTYLDRDNRSRPGLRPLDTPQHVAYAELDQRLTTDLRALLGLRHESGRYSSSDGLRRTRAFSVVNATLDWKLPRGLALQAGVLNAGDRDYAYEEGFPEPGRTWFTTLSVDY